MHEEFLHSSERYQTSIFPAACFLAYGRGRGGTKNASSCPMAQPSTSDSTVLQEQSGQIIQEGRRLRAQSKLLIDHARWVVRRCEHECAVANRLRETARSLQRSLRQE